jgi:hypothetical protein
MLMHISYSEKTTQRSNLKDHIYKPAHRDMKISTPSSYLAFWQQYEVEFCTTKDVLSIIWSGM